MPESRRHEIEYTTFQYKGATCLIEMWRPPKQPTVVISPPTLPERLNREVQAIGMCYVIQHQRRGRFPTFEIAKQTAAYLLMPSDPFGDDLRGTSPEVLADLAVVTPDFARYRIGLDRRRQLEAELGFVLDELGKRTPSEPF